MKVVIESQKLRDGLNKVLTVVDKKNSRPILTNCLVQIKNGSLQLIATDLEVTAKIILKADTTSEGNFCINIKNIFDILRELPDDSLEMIIDEEKNLLNLNCKNINYSLLISNSEEYPQVNFDNVGNRFKLHSQEILKIINKASHAISTDETRINLNGIYLQQLESKLRAVAIDGHRLALLDINNFDGNSNHLINGVIIPRKGITELKKMADAHPDESLELTLDDSFIYVNAGQEYFLSVRLIAREYPKYQTVIPNKTTYQFRVERNAILNAVRRIRILSNEKTNGVKLSITATELTVSANHPSLGHAKEIVPINYEGQEMEIGFNAKYMIESISVLDESEIYFEFNNELSPVVVRSENLPDFLGIIMPLKL